MALRRKAGELHLLDQIGTLTNTVMGEVGGHCIMSKTSLKKISQLMSQVYGRARHLCYWPEEYIQQVLILQRCPTRNGFQQEKPRFFGYFARKVVGLTQTKRILSEETGIFSDFSAKRGGGLAPNQNSISQIQKTKI